MLVRDGRSVSEFGSGMSTIAFPLLILSLTNSPAQAGIAGGLRAIAILLLGLPGGTLADRWNQRNVMAMCDAGRAVALLSIPIAFWVGSLSIIHLYIVSLAEGALTVIYSKAFLIALPRIVPAGQLTSASSQNEGSHYVTAQLLGPAAAGALYQIGRVLSFIGDSVSYMLSLFSLIFVRANLNPQIKGKVQSRIFADMRVGFMWVWRNRLFRNLPILDGGSALVWSIISLIVVVLAKSQGASSTATGLIFSVAAVGGILGALFGRRVLQTLPFGKILIALTWLLAALFALYALANSAIALGIVTAGIYFLNTVKNVAMVSYALPQIPEELRGRVMGVRDVIPHMLALLGPTVAGVAPQSAGPTTTVIAGALVLALIALFSTLSPSIRQA